MVTEETVAEARSLPSQWSAQQAELHALIQALQLSKGKKTNTDTGVGMAIQSQSSLAKGPQR